MTLRLTDSQMPEVRQAALSVPWDLHGAFLEQHYAARISVTVSCIGWRTR